MSSFDEEYPIANNDEEFSPDAPVDIFGEDEYDEDNDWDFFDDVYEDDFDNDLPPEDFA